MLGDFFICYYFAKSEVFLHIKLWLLLYQVFPNSLKLCPSLCDPLRIMFHQIPRGTGVKFSQLWCLISNPLILCRMGNVQGRTQYFLFIPIWVAMTDFPVRDTLGKIQGNPRCVSPLVRFVNPFLKTFSPAAFRPFPYIGCCTSVIMPWKRKAASWWSQLMEKVWWHAGGWSVCLGLIHWSCVQQFRFNGEIPPTVAYLLTTGLDWLLEQRLWKYYVVLPIGTYPGPMGGC